MVGANTNDIDSAYLTLYFEEKEYKFIKISKGAFGKSEVGSRDIKFTGEVLHI